MARYQYQGLSSQSARPSLKPSVKTKPSKGSAKPQDEADPLPDSVPPQAPPVNEDSHAKEGSPPKKRVCIVWCRPGLKNQVAPTLLICLIVT